MYIYIYIYVCVYIYIYYYQHTIIVNFLTQDSYLCGFLQCKFENQNHPPTTKPPV